MYINTRNKQLFRYSIIHYTFLIENDIILRKRITNQLGFEVAEAAAGDRVSIILEHIFN